MTATLKPQVWRYRTVEAAARLDLPGLLRAHRRLQPAVWGRWAAGGDAAVFHRLQQPLVRGGKVVGTVKVGLALHGRQGWVRLGWTAPDSAGEVVVDLVAYLSPIAGLRWAWTCPVSGVACLALYLPRGAHRFASRTAHGLDHAVTRETRKARAARRARKLRRKLGEVPAGILGGTLPLQPLRMTPRIYAWNCRAIREAEAQALASIQRRRV